ncbi:hypothetical protein M427DRAFT_151099 [Gonapodya prolifera JEL478]|uniref:Lecithin:cholesterol acyltransferase n=1 Tax=Gonapodya prolifera (strain JEL478) TaxID=1344416 RepID=A0A139AZ47_GONPJ|nr:hypothetical protein M427DRAFT_151099 [Gonapodya prolifera JEL478]|eukprot:KXS21833.1 hypothetical protein M427DRAFT_151099 [Gonapodya prolifera JEL478]
MANRPPVPIAGEGAEGTKTSSVSAFFNEFKTRSPGELKRDLGWKPHLPVVIMPGFMSSGLQVHESEVRPGWIDSRVWLSIEKLGLGVDFNEVFSRSKPPSTTSSAASSTIHLDSAAATPSAKKRDAMTILRSFVADIGDTFNDDDDNEDNDTSHTSLAQESQGHPEDQNVRTMSRMWLRHVGLDPSCVDDPKSQEHGGDGRIRVEPIEGLDGVNFLQPGALTATATYVFAPVIAELRNLGYTEKNLAGAPYDWRYPPQYCQKNDQYFTKTVKTIEDLKKNNDGLPVVILAHSMGNRMVGYFCNWVSNQEGLGVKWLQEHVHSIYAAGPPTMGSSKSVRSVVTGDSMGLPFLNREECIWFARHLGSPPFLFPTDGWDILSPIFKDRKIAFTRVESYFTVTIHSVSFIKDVPASLPQPGKKINVRINWRGRTDDHTTGAVLRQSQDNEKADAADADTIVTWNERFQLPLKPPGKIDRDITTILSLETREEDLRGVVAGDLRARVHIDLTERLLAVFDRPETLPSGQEAMFMNQERIDIFSEPDTLLNMEWRKKHPEANSDGRPIKVGSILLSASFTPDTYDEKDPNIHMGWSQKGQGKLAYRALTIPEVLRADGAVVTARLQEDLEKDPFYGVVPKTQSPDAKPEAAHAANDFVCTRPPPGVKKVHLVYGSGRQTEVGFVLRRRTTRIDLGPHKVPWMLYKLDADVRVPGFACSKGVIFEDRNTPQNDPETGQLKKSGDGTVAYASLRHIVNWRKEGVEVTTVELPGAEHRAMLNEVKFLEDLVTYVALKPEQELDIQYSKAEQLAQDVAKMKVGVEQAKQKVGKALGSVKDFFGKK